MFRPSVRHLNKTPHSEDAFIQWLMGLRVHDNGLNQPIPGVRNTLRQCSWWKTVVQPLREDCRHQELAMCQNIQDQCNWTVISPQWQCCSTTVSKACHRTSSTSWLTTWGVIISPNSLLDKFPVGPCPFRSLPFKKRLATKTGLINKPMVSVTCSYYQLVHGWDAQSYQTDCALTRCTLSVLK